MGSCCLVTKTKDDFKGFRFIKDEKQKFRLEKIDNSERPIRKKAIKILKLLLIVLKNIKKKVKTKNKMKN